jgi:SSS family transporter
MHNFHVIIATQNVSEIGAHFGWLDWLVVIGYLVLTTFLGGALAGKQATIRDFFLGGRKLPWYAVSGSIIATEISAVTFVGVPALVYVQGGNFTYLQLCLFGAILSRFVVGYFLVPAYYRKEIYSPYDYMANQLGGRVRSVTTGLFTLGGMLAQGARVYLTALILDLVVGRRLFGELSHWTGIESMTWSIFVIGLVAVAWTLLGGITTVIWTDVILFLVFLIGGVVALAYILAEIPGGLMGSAQHIFDAGLHAKDAGPWGKFTLFNFDFDPSQAYTIWTAVIAYTIWCISIYGTDQLFAQRIFCCSGPKQARRAIIASSFGQIISVIMMLVGVGLFTYYQYHSLSGQASALVTEKPDRIFPLFIIQVLPPGVTGLLIAGIFAAAISSLDSILAALSQTTISALYLPWRKKHGRNTHDDNTHDHHVVTLSRLLVIFWAIILCFMALVADAATAKYPQILDLALSMAGYTGGALLAGFALAYFKPKMDERGFVWAAPLSVIIIFALVWHHPWTHAICWSAAGIALATWLWALARQRVYTITDGVQSIILVMVLVLMIWLNYYGYFEKQVDPVTGTVSYVTIAWPWFCLIGFVFTFVFSIVLARPVEEPVYAEEVDNAPVYYG